MSSSLLFSSEIKWRWSFIIEGFQHEEQWTVCLEMGWAESIFSLLSSNLLTVLCYSWHLRQLFPRKWTPGGDLTSGDGCVLASSHCNTCLRQSACKDERFILTDCVKDFIPIALEPGVREQGMVSMWADHSSASQPARKEWAERRLAL